MTNSPWGIDKLQTKRALTPEEAAALDEKCKVFGQCFGTAAGRKVLNILVEELEVSVWDPNRGPNYGYYREGQNDVIRFILNRVNYARRTKK